MHIAIYTFTINKQCTEMLKVFEQIIAEKAIMLRTRSSMILSLHAPPPIHASDPKFMPNLLDKPLKRIPIVDMKSVVLG